jgi:hypothetical protein
MTLMSMVASAVAASAAMATRAARVGRAGAAGVAIAAGVTGATMTVMGGRNIGTTSHGHQQYDAIHSGNLLQNEKRANPRVKRKTSTPGAF